MTLSHPMRSNVKLLKLPQWSLAQTPACICNTPSLEKVWISANSEKVLRLSNHCFCYWPLSVAYVITPVHTIRATHQTYIKLKGLEQMKTEKVTR